ncbi:MAG: orotidine-5'-phosphate decarboxylase [Ignavibacteria bacterium]|jgi:orotidine-5'-phosphate decarboxylase|nr:orotidine-5'-phosphate decarboxylase [Ignavibacteria bacterium]
MRYKDKLRYLIRKSNSNLVVGLDTDLDKIPDFCRNKRLPLYKFNEMIILATKDYCLGYKINLAFYEATGIDGLKALEKTMKYISGMKLTICDAKRGDIGNTSEQYAKSVFANLNFDAVTLSPYMGTDSIAPFLADKNKFAYILVRTSNRSADEIQNLKSGKKRVYEVVADKMINKFGRQVGFVVGANHFKDVNKFSALNSEIPLLIPGIGAQDNDLERLMKNIKNELFVINASRSVIYAGNRNMSYREYYECVRSSAQKLNEEINSRKNIRK